MRRKSVTITDIARNCGVSVATVSRVLSNTDYPISDDIRESVVSAAAALGYKVKRPTPDSIDRSANTVGIIIPNISNDYYSYLLQAIQDTLEKRNFQLIICISNNDSNRENEQIELLIEKQVKGMMIIGMNTSKTLLKQAMKKGFKVVTLEQQTDLVSSHVGFDFYKGAVIAVDHLYKKGHRAIGFACGSLDRSSRASLYHGFTESLENYNLPISNEWIYLDKEELSFSKGTTIPEFRIGERVATYFSNLENRPSAIFCANDMIAFSLIQHFSTLNIQVPEDISIIGFDNIPLGQITTPHLTTIDQNIYDLGKMGSDMIVNMITDKIETNMVISLEPTLVERQTVKQISTKA